MTKVLLLAAALGLTASAAGACEFMRSADAKVDSMTVASTAARAAFFGCRGGARRASAMVLSPRVRQVYAFE